MPAVSRESLKARTGDGEAEIVDHHTRNVATVASPSRESSPPGLDWHRPGVGGGEGREERTESIKHSTAAAAGIQRPATQSQSNGYSPTTRYIAFPPGCLDRNWQKAWPKAGIGKSKERGIRRERREALAAPHAQHLPPHPEYQLASALPFLGRALNLVLLERDPPVCRACKAEGVKSDDPRFVCGNKANSRGQSAAKQLIHPSYSIANPRSWLWEAGRLPGCVAGVGVAEPSTS